MLTYLAAANQQGVHHTRQCDCQSLPRAHHTGELMIGPSDGPSVIRQCVSMNNCKPRMPCYFNPTYPQCDCQCAVHTNDMHSRLQVTTEQLQRKPKDSTWQHNMQRVQEALVQSPAAYQVDALHCQHVHQRRPSHSHSPLLPDRGRGKKGEGKTVSELTIKANQQQIQQSVCSSKHTQLLDSSAGRNRTAQHS